MHDTPNHRANLYEHAYAYAVRSLPAVEFDITGDDANLTIWAWRAGDDDLSHRVSTQFSWEDLFAEADRLNLIETAIWVMEDALAPMGAVRRAIPGDRLA